MECRICANFPCTRKECDIDNKQGCYWYKSLVKKESEEIENES